MWTRERLVAHLDSGGAVDYLFFWGHTPKVAGVVDNACFSQWFPRAFEVDGVRYATAEHFMMAGKARTFGDDDALSKILEARTPAEAKALGRQVRRYDDVKWGSVRSEIVVHGNVAKFGQHEDLRARLLSTHDRVLV